jgi:hypothetical protein
MILRPTYLASFIILSTFLFQGCDKAQPTDPNPPSEATTIWPLAIGNMWIYDIKRYDTLGTVVEAYIDTTSVSDTVSFDGTRWYNLVGYTSAFFVNRPSGLYVGFPGLLDMLLFKYPANVGDSTQYTSNAYYVVKSIDEPVTVMSQVMMAYRYDLRSASGVTKEYLVPNLGRVQIIGTDATQSRILYRLTLIDYSLRWPPQPVASPTVPRSEFLMEAGFFRGQC